MSAPTSQPRPGMRGVSPSSSVPPMLVASMGSAIVGGIVLAAYLPRQAPLGIPVAFLVIAVVLLLGAVVAMTRLPAFAWGRFFEVLRWALLAYVVIVGLLAYVFVLDGTRGAVLAILLSILAVFGADVPILLAFSVARYERVGAGEPAT